MINLKNKDNGALLALIMDRAEAIRDNREDERATYSQCREIITYAQTLESRGTIQAIINRKD